MSVQMDNFQDLIWKAFSFSFCAQNLRGRLEDYWWNIGLHCPAVSAILQDIFLFTSHWKDVTSASEAELSILPKISQIWTFWNESANFEVEKMQNYCKIANFLQISHPMHSGMAGWSSLVMVHIIEISICWETLKTMFFSKFSSLICTLFAVSRTVFRVNAGRNYRL